MKIIYDVIVASRMQDDFMHQSGTFEPDKRLGVFGRWKSDSKGALNRDELLEHQQRVQKLLEEKDQIVIFLSLIHDGIQYTNHVDPYILPETQTISNGMSTNTFKDILEGLGYEVTTDKHLHVLTAKFKLTNVPQ